MQPTTETTPTAQKVTTWTIDNSHTSATFKVRHLMISNVRGEFQKVAGKVTYDPAKPEATKIEVTIDVASINTREAQRDTHLKSPDFFDVEKFPQITFVSKSTTRTDDGFRVTGDLTIHGTTREAVLEVEGPTSETKDMYGNQRIGAAARTKIKRSDYGMTWNAAIEAGGVVVGDEVKIELDVSLVKDK